MSSKLKNFDKTNLNNLRKELEKTFGPLEKQYGIKFSMNSFRYSDKEFYFKTSVNIVTPGNETLSGTELKYKNNLTKHGWKFGVTTGMYGKTVTLQKFGQCTFIGTKDRMSNAPFIYKAKNGSLIRSFQNPSHA